MQKKNQHLFIVLSFLILFIILFLTDKAHCEGTAISLKYLNMRMTKVTLSDRKQITIWRTSDEDLIKKGIMATTFETALVTRAYLKHYELFKKPDSLNKALDGLHFLYFMQAKNGCFYNYLKENGEIDTESHESTPDLGEHTAQAFFTLAEGSRILRKETYSDYNKVEDSFLQVCDFLKKWLNDPQHSGKYIKWETMNIPAWLINGRGDLSSIYLLGLGLFAENSPSLHELSQISGDIGQAIIEFKNISPNIFPPYAHLTFSDSPNIWKTANAFQVASLAYAGKIFSRDNWIREAESEAVGFLMHLPVSYGPVAGFYPHPEIYPQTPLAAYTLTYNFTTMARVTGDEKYAKVAGICASWFFKNNPAGKPLYSNDDGSCFKEINNGNIVEEKEIEASACALLALMEVYHNRGNELLAYKPEMNHTFIVFESENGKPVHEDFEVTDIEYQHNSKGKAVTIRRRNTFWHKFNINVEDDYFFLMSFKKQQLYSASVAVNIRVDGGPILLVPLGGAIGEPYFLMQKVIDPIRLIPGLHTVGVRYRGLLFSIPAVIDCLILQPALERKQLVNDKGQRLMLVKNWNLERKKMEIPENLIRSEVFAEVKSIDGSNISDPLRTEKGKKVLLIPREGFGLIQW